MAAGSVAAGALVSGAVAVVGNGRGFVIWGVGLVDGGAVGFGVGAGAVGAGTISTAAGVGAATVVDGATSFAVDGTRDEVGGSTAIASTAIGAALLMRSMVSVGTSLRGRRVAGAVCSTSFRADEQLVSAQMKSSARPAVVVILRMVLIWQPCW